MEENLIRSRKLQSGQAERLLRILIAGKIDEISDVAERRVAETLKAEALRMTENEAFNRQSALFENDYFADEITVEIVGHEDFKVSLHVPKNANKTLSLKTLSGDINKIAAAIGEKLQLAKAFSSAKREISANLPLLSQLENDAKLILEFEPI